MGKEESNPLPERVSLRFAFEDGSFGALGTSDVADFDTLNKQQQSGSQACQQVEHPFAS